MEDVTDEHWLLQVKHGFERLHREKLLTDVTLKVGNQEFKCHKNILCVFSSYFECMFHSGMMESQEKVVELEMVEAGPMDLLIQYMYSGSVAMDKHNIAKLLWTATFLQMNGFLKLMRQGYDLNSHIHMDNFWDLWFLAESHHDCVFLKDPLNSFVSTHFEEVSKTPEFQDISSEDFLSILNNERLMVKSEDIILYSILAWVNHSREARDGELARLIQAVRLPFCQKSSLEKLKNFRDDLDQSVRDNLKVAEQYQQDRGGQMCFATSQSKFRPNAGKEKVLILINEENDIHSNTSSFHVINLDDSICYPSISFKRNLNPISYQPDGMLTVLPYSFRRGGFTTCTYAESCVYLCGHFEQSNAFFCYSAIKDRWQRLEPCPGACRIGAHIVAIRDRIYLFGGEDIDTGMLQPEVFVYNVTTSHWNIDPLCHLRFPVTKCQKGCLGDKIYIFGGLTSLDTGRYVTGYVQCIDTTNQTCSLLCSSDIVRGAMPQGCAYSCRADGTVHIVYNNKFTSSLLIVKFDPASLTKLEVVSSIPTSSDLYDFSHCSFGIVKQDSNLVVVIKGMRDMESASHIHCAVNLTLKTKVFFESLKAVDFQCLALTDEMMTIDVQHESLEDFDGYFLDQSD